MWPFSNQIYTGLHNYAFSHKCYFQMCRSAGVPVMMDMHPGGESVWVSCSLKLYNEW